MEPTWSYTIKNLINNTEANKIEDEQRILLLKNQEQTKRNPINNSNNNYLTDNDDDCASTISSSLVLPNTDFSSKLVKNSFLESSSNIKNLNQTQNQQETFLKLVDPNSRSNHKNKNDLFIKSDSLKYFKSKNNCKKKNRINYTRNYYSATEGDEEEYHIDDDGDDDAESGVSIALTDNPNYYNNRNNYDNPNLVSHASITLRQPLKDVNYFSDTEKSSLSKKNSFLIRNRNYNNNSNTLLSKFSSSDHFTKNPTNNNNNNLKKNFEISANYNNRSNLDNISNRSINLDSNVKRRSRISGSNNNDFKCLTQPFNNSIENSITNPRRNPIEKEENYLKIIEPRKKMVSFQQQQEQQQMYHNPHGFSKLSPLNSRNMNSEMGQNDNDTNSNYSKSRPTQQVYSSVNFQNKPIQQATPKPYTPYNYWSANPAFVGGSGANSSGNSGSILNQQQSQQQQQQQQHQQHSYQNYNMNEEIDSKTGKLNISIENE
jgi:hypothetical protein